MCECGRSVSQVKNVFMFVFINSNHYTKKQARKGGFDSKQDITMMICKVRPNCEDMTKAHEVVALLLKNQFMIRVNNYLRQDRFQSADMLCGL